MFHKAFVSVLFLSVPVVAFAQIEQQDYTSQLLKPTTSADDKQYREALNLFRQLEAQPGTPGWLKAACEYEIAEMHGALQENDGAMNALAGAVRLGFDDCVTPSSSEHLRTILQDPKARQTIAAMKIMEADFRELVWLKAEVLHAQHDGRMMVVENTNRIDTDATVVPQSQLPMRPTTSAGVRYWRQQLLLRQKVQREFVMRADIMRIQHATRMRIIGGISSAAVIESARRAKIVAESRRLEIRKRAFVPVAPLLGPPRSCSDWNRAVPGAPPSL